MRPQQHEIANELMRHGIENNDPISIARATITDGEFCQYEREHYERVIESLLDLITANEQRNILYAYRGAIDSAENVGERAEVLGAVSG